MPTENQLPTYIAVKRVSAFKIAAQEMTEPVYGAPWRLSATDPGIDPVIVTSEFMSNYRPEIGGYYVVADLPMYMAAAAFEREYTRG